MDLSSAAGVILMTIIMGTVGRAIGILAVKFGQTFAAKIPPIIMSALVFGLPKCPPLPPAVLWLIPGCGPNAHSSRLAHETATWILEKMRRSKSKLASPPALDMPTLDNLKAKAKAALDAANAALEGNKAALDIAKSKAGLAIAAAKEAAVDAKNGAVDGKAEGR